MGVRVCVGVWVWVCVCVWGGDGCVWAVDIAHIYIIYVVWEMGIVSIPWPWSDGGKLELTLMHYLFCSGLRMTKCK